MCQSERLQKLQNRTACLITFFDLNVRSSTLLGDLGWDSLERRRSKKPAIILFKTLHNLSPTRLNSIFKATSSVLSHNLRIQNTTFSFLDRILEQANKVSISRFCSKFYKECMGSLVLLPPSNFAVLDSLYFLKYYMQRAKNWVDC